MTHPTWDQASLALRLLALDPVGLGGVWVRARSGPVRDRFLDAVSNLPGAQTKIPATATDDALFGGLDLAQTLDRGHTVRTTGLLAREGVWLLTMAERIPSDLAGRITLAMDDGTKATVVALDEGVDDEILPPGITDRLAFHLDLEGLRLAETATIPLQQGHILDICTPDDIAQTITSIATQFGITSARAILFTLRAARAHAALHQRDTVDDADVMAAAGLVLAPRATQVPTVEEDDPVDTPPPPDATEPDGDQGKGNQDDLTIPEDILLEAVKAALPADLLAQVAARNHRVANGGGSGSGDRQKGNRRGRPLAPRQGRFDGRARLDLVATLRAAAPWQMVRKRTAKTQRPIHIRSTDLRFKRFEDQSDRLLIFTVDASGSAAIARLAEAKGAVELLLAEAYARRDHVSLVAFRGNGAELLLPPTRSLVQTKRRLASLAGGGGTPLAAGLKTAMDVARSAKGKGLTPTVALLTDGRANIALDGTANRAQAAADAQRMAQQAQSESIQGLVIDVSKRPEKALQSLASHLAAPYIPLPRADAKRLSQAVSASLDAM